MDSGYFVTGTDDRVGKTELAIRLAEALVADGQRVTVFRPSDAGSEQLAATGARVVVPERADLEGLLEAVEQASIDTDVLIVVGVGGLLTPLDGSALVRDLAAALGLPLLVAARPAAGTINHTLLTLEAAYAAELQVEAVVLGPWPQDPDPEQVETRDLLAALSGVEVRTLDRR